ncbi:MAG: alpha/beta hydrolase [Peptostreptococcaceae bacterium]
MNSDMDTKNIDLDKTLSITMELERPLFIDKIEEETKTNEKKKKKKKTLLVCLYSLIIIMLISFGIWVATPYKAASVANTALISDENVKVNIGDFISFTPQNTEVTKGLILYPGAKVDAKAYAPLAKGVAKEGYEVIIVDMPLNFAMLGTNKAQKVIKEYPHIKNWAIGGHSLGGVAASKFIIDNPQIDGLILLASYPMGDELKNLGVDVLSIWGSKDGVLNFENLIASKMKLPVETEYVEIEGGNHAQFGDYGQQKGDHNAIISADEQLKITEDSITNFLKNIDK